MTFEKRYAKECDNFISGTGSPNGIFTLWDGIVPFVLHLLWVAASFAAMYWCGSHVPVSKSDQAIGDWWMVPTFVFAVYTFLGTVSSFLPIASRYADESLRWCFPHYYLSAPRRRLLRRIREVGPSLTHHHEKYPWLADPETLRFAIVKESVAALVEEIDASVSQIDKSRQDLENYAELADLRQALWERRSVLVEKRTGLQEHLALQEKQYITLSGELYSLRKAEDTVRAFLRLKEADTLIQKIEHKSEELRMIGYQMNAYLELERDAVKELTA
jgi:hypothetical protein